MISFNRHIFGFVIAILIFAPLSVFGQDLGSSTELLKASRKKTSSKKKSRSSRSKSSNVSRNSKTKSAPKKVETASKKSPESKEKEAIKPEKIVEISPSKNIVETAVVTDSGKAEEYYENAIEEGNNGRNSRNYDSAETAYRRAQSLNPKDSRAIYGLGNLYSDQGRWEEAESAYRLAVQIEPESSAAYVALSFVLTQPAPGTNLIERYVEAEKLARRAIELDSENAVAFDQLGVSLELQGNVSDETRIFYQKAVKLDPTFALAYAHLGRLMRKKGLVDESSNAYVNAIQYSADVPTMILVADVMQSQQRYLDSEDLLRRALKEDPKNPTGLYLLGRALTVRGKYEEAENVLKKSAEVSPKSFVSYTLLSSLYLRRGIFESAEGFLQQAMKIVSPNERRRLSFEFEAVGDGYLAAGNKEDALRVYQTAISLDLKRSELEVKLNLAKPVDLTK